MKFDRTKAKKIMPGLFQLAADRKHKAEIGDLVKYAEADSRWVCGGRRDLSRPHGVVMSDSGGLLALKA